MISIKKKASYKDLSIIAGNIGKLYDEGISLLNILNLIDELPLKREYKVLLKQMEKVIKEGGSLSDGFKSGGELIPSFFSSMVNIGEITGKIVYVLKGLETFYDKCNNISFIFTSSIISFRYLCYIFLYTKYERNLFSNGEGYTPNICKYNNA